jgi:hypothetical protein
MLLGASCEAPGTGWSGAPLWPTILACLGQRAPHAGGVEILRVDWSAWLLSPGFIQPAGINAVEAELVNESQHDSLALVGGARSRQRTILHSISLLSRENTGNFRDFGRYRS